MIKGFLYYMRHVRRITPNPVGDLATDIRQDKNLPDEFETRADAFRYFSAIRTPGVIDAFEKAWNAFQVWTVYQARQGSKFKK